MLEKQQQLEMEQYKIQKQEEDLRRIFTGE
jgi:hypothetical protein